MKIRKKDALDYHSEGRRGKIEVVPTKSFSSQRDLSLAYSPGVAEPCREIYANPEEVFRYTAKGNLVAVITNGTAVLGLGDIGPDASKPVMEGKGCLFKKFADIDVFDIEVSTKDVDAFVETVKNIAPTFGGINLEDIRSPECFEIERKLREELDIPIFHDDQHGTAIITTAALKNALELTEKKASKVKVVFSGAGASAVACADLFVKTGVDPRNLRMVDSKGVIFKGRKENMNAYKEKYASSTKVRTLAEAMKGADVFVGLSAAGLVTKAMVKSMAKNPIVFALANPDPEISYDDAKAARSDVIMATGRSDFPNQVNNVLGFPFIFRGALDVRAKTINEEMKLAAAEGLAELARSPVTGATEKAYPGQKLEFGPDYIIPKPFDQRVLLTVAPAVAKAAMETGVARKKIADLAKYREELEKLLSRTYEIMRGVINRAKEDPKRIVFAEGAEPQILQAAQILVEEGIADPILLGDEKEIAEKAKELDLSLDGFEIINHRTTKNRKRYAKALYDLRQRKGVHLKQAEAEIDNANVFASLMAHLGDADGVVAGLTHPYPETIRPALQVIGIQEGFEKVCGVYLVLTRNQLFFFADATVNIDPTSEDLAEIAIHTADLARHFHVEPRIAMLSFSNFGSADHPFVHKVREATELVRERRPDLKVDGEMQFDTAVVPEIVEETYPFSQVKEANILIFPDLQSANIAYKMMERIGNAETIGPLLLGTTKPVNVLQQGALVEQIINVAAITVMEAQGIPEMMKGRPKKKRPSNGGRKSNRRPLKPGLRAETN